MRTRNTKCLQECKKLANIGSKEVTVTMIGKSPGCSFNQSCYISPSTGQADIAEPEESKVSPLANHA